MHRFGLGAARGARIVPVSVAQYPLIVVSIVNWHTAETTLRCLRSVYASSYPNLRVVVVDNASADDSVEQLRSAYPDLTVLRSDENIGFAAGHALAWRQAVAWGAEAIWLLDSDAEVDALALARLVVAWQQHGDALYGGLPLCDRGATTMLNFPTKFLDPGWRPRVFQRDVLIEFTSAWRQHAPLRVGAIIGNCMLLPRALVEQHGWMDHAWFLYCEEIDYCCRLRARGVSCYLVPQAQTWHRGGGSHRRWPRVEDCVHYYRARNEIVLTRRHAGMSAALAVAMKKVLRGAYQCLRRPQRGWQIWHGVVDALGGRMGKTLAPEAGMAPASLGSAIKQALGAVSARLQRRALRQQTAGVASIAFNPKHPIFIRHYYLYCVALFRQRLLQETRPINVVFGDYAVTFANAQRTLHIDLQYEHTLVKPGGRDSAGAEPGTVPIADSDACYLVRIERYHQLRQLDAVIEYSGPNLANIAACGRFGAYLENNVLIAPLLYAFDAGSSHRPEGIISLFGDTAQPRRSAFLQRAQAAGLPLQNIQRVFDAEALRHLYRRTRVLVNVHQTDHHHTFEELRVLPALLCGVVVVSEEVPLKEHIPYARFIIWSRHQDLIETARETEENHAQHYQRIFGDPELARVLEAMRQSNLDAVDRAVRRMLGDGSARDCLATLEPR